MAATPACSENPELAATSAPERSGSGGSVCNINTFCPSRGPVAIRWELSGRRALVRDEWKLLWEPRADGPPRWELFDMATDPYERNDLFSERLEVTRELIDAWQAYADEVGVMTGE